MSKLIRSFTIQGEVTGSISCSGVWDIVVKYSSLAQIHCRPHDLRRTFAKLSYSGGAPLDVVQKTLGHSSIRTTEVYLGTGAKSNAGDYFKL